MFEKVNELKGLIASIVYYHILIDDLENEETSNVGEILYREKAIEAYKQRIETLEQYYADVFDELVGLN